MESLLKFDKMNVPTSFDRVSDLSMFGVEKPSLSTSVC